MNRADALPLARRLAAAVCDIDTDTAGYADYMREGKYDDEREVQCALAGVLAGHRLAMRAKPVLVADAT